MQTSGIYGSNNTWGEDVVHSGLWNKGSYSLGQYHYETDGFRKNNFVNQDIYNAFIQGDITDSLNLQAEYRHEERDNGDLSINFDNFFQSKTESRILENYRLGGKYTFSPESTLIGSLIYQEAKFKTNEPSVLDTNVERNGFISELQHHFSNSSFSSISGFGHINQIFKTKLIFPPEFGIPNQDPISQEVTKTSFYNYSNFNLTNKLRTTLGLSYDTFNFEGDIKKNPVNPKLGLIWNPLSSTTFRAALFRSINITSISNQTIEPTQVAGFNQFFDDVTGTVAWRYGAAIDHVFSKKIAAGLEYSERKLDVPSSGFSFNWSEQLGRAYAYLTPIDYVSISFEYFYESFNRNINHFNGNNPSDGILDVKTHWIPITLNVFHTSGLSVMLKSSFVNQYGFFERFGTPYSGSSNFFIFDVNLNYRLPSRYGMLSFGIKNLFNNHFQYQNTNQINSNERLFSPEMTLFTQLKLAF